MPLPRLTGELTMEAFSQMKKNAEKMRFERTGLIPKNVGEYSRQQMWYQKLRDEVKNKKMEQNATDLATAETQERGLTIVFDGKVIGDGNVGVLGMPTIWSRNWTATEAHPLAPWPCAREFREEGDERYTSNYGRFLPIPRVPGNPTVTFKHKSWNPVEMMDKVMSVPKLYTVVNLNNHGFFDTTVDEEGVLYDDEDLDGNEYIVGEPYIAAKSAMASSASGPNNNGVNVTMAPMHQESSGSPAPIRRASRLRAVAAPFVSRINRAQGDRVSNLGELFGTLNADSIIERENLMPQASGNAGSGGYGAIGDKRPIEVEMDPASLFKSINSHVIGADKVEKKQEPAKPVAPEAGSQSEQTPLPQYLLSLFEHLNADLINKDSVRQNSGSNSAILQTNTNRIFTRESFATPRTMANFDSSPFTGEVSSLGLYTPSESSPMCPRNKPAQ